MDVVSTTFLTGMVGTDSSQKIQQRWLPSIDEALNHVKDTSYMAFAVAAWVNFINKV